MDSSPANTQGVSMPKGGTGVAQLKKKQKESNGDELERSVRVFLRIRPHAIPALQYEFIDNIAEVSFQRKAKAIFF